MTRYIIIGAGAIGGGIGGRLAQAGTPTVLVARGDHLAALQSHGMRLRSPEDDLTVPVVAVGSPDELELHDDDVLVLATKTHQATAALIPWADASVYVDGVAVGTAGERLPVLTALNGVASEQMALRYFSRVFGVCVWMPAVHLEPGEVIIRGVPISGMFHIGRVPSAQADDEDQALLDQLQNDWTAAGFAVTLPEDVMPWKYRKLISNIGNAFQALVGTNGNTKPLVQAADREARDVLEAAGITVTDDAEEKEARSHSFTVKPVPGEPAELGGSTWQSLTRGTGNVESDYLNGEIAQIAHAHGLAAPINSRIASLARRAAADGQKPGSVSADELAEALGLAGARS
ncbi:MAG: 2-dehydropantoate 2-reductase N-terminal domain-containing protein [Propionibacteriaceae bacterium]